MMNATDTLGTSGELQLLVDFARKYEGSPELRARAETEPHAVLTEHGISMPPKHDVRIVANTAETFNLVMPPDPNSVLADAQLEAVAGGTRPFSKCASTLVSCALCFS